MAILLEKQAANLFPVFLGARVSYRFVFDRKSMINHFQDEKESYTLRKVISSFILIEKHEWLKCRTRYMKMDINKVPEYRKASMNI